MMTIIGGRVESHHEGQPMLFTGVKFSSSESGVVMGFAVDFEDGVIKGTMIVNMINVNSAKRAPKPSQKTKSPRIKAIIFFLFLFSRNKNFIFVQNFYLFFFS